MSTFVVVAWTAVALSLTGCVDRAGLESRTVVMAPSSFHEHLGLLMAPLDANDTLVERVVINLRCLDTPTFARACVRETDPLEPSIANTWCVHAACDDSVTGYAIEVPLLTTDERAVLELVVQSPTLASVEIRSAVITLAY